MGGTTKNGARETLLATAERLFADQGIEAVSLRAINTEAGYSVAALHYHFGTRDTLVQQLLEERRQAIVARRHSLIGKMASVKRPSMAGIAEAIVSPYADLIRDDNEAGLRTVRFLYRAHQDNVGAPWVKDIIAENYGLYAPLLRAAMPGLKPGDRRLRWLMAQDYTLQGLASTDDMLGNRGLKCTPTNRRHYIDELTGFIARGLSAD